MATMKAALFYGPYDMRIEEVPLPALGEHDVLCRVVRSGVCGTDYAIYTGELSFVKEGSITFPLRPGHEWSGVVEAVGPGVRTLQVGDRVTGDTAVACGNCNKCLLGRYYDCPDIRSVGTVKAWDGSHAQCMMMPERHLFRLPDNVSFDNGALIEPAATALYAVHRARVGLADTVVVQGSGPIGIMAAKFCKLAGASRVIITGRKDPKLQAALTLGVDAAVNTTKEPLVEAVRRLAAPYPVDKVVECSGSAELLASSFELVRPAGVVSAVAFYERPVEGFQIDRLVLGSLALEGVGGSLGMYPIVLKLMAHGLDFTPLISARYPFPRFADALRDMGKGDDRRIKLMLEMDHD